jgi:hypothetical protein
VCVVVVVVVVATSFGWKRPLLLRVFQEPFRFVVYVFEIGGKIFRQGNLNLAKKLTE